MKKLASIFVLIALFATPSLYATPIDSVDLDDHTIELISMNEFDGAFYVWTYKVTSGSSPAISHWILDFCTDFFDSANEASEAVDPDPTVGISGIKFDDGYTDGEMRLVKLFLTKSVEGIETEMSVGLKAGGNTDVGMILAPSCNCLDDPVPEPTTIVLIGAGIMGMTARRKKLI